MTALRVLVAVVTTAALGLVAAATATPLASGTGSADRCTPRIRVPTSAPVEGYPTSTAVWTCAHKLAFQPPAR